MKKLNKEQIAEHTRLSAELHDAHEELDGAVTKYNEKVAAAYAELEPFVANFNTKVTAANEFVEQIHEEQQSFFDEKSEKWQEGDAGSAYTDWMGMWDLEIDTIELDEISQLETPDVVIEDFDGLETECST
jgi:hypothetical protein